MGRIDYNRAFAGLPKIMGVEMKFKYGLWYAACTLDLTKHPRPDKMVCKLRTGTEKGDTILILEQGGRTMTIWSWLMHYGGCVDNAAVVSRLKMEGEYISELKMPKQPPAKHVLRSIFDKDMSQVGHIEDGLFLALCDLFPRNRVIAAYVKFNVCPFVLRSGHIGTCFWYIDRAGNICHDNIVVYGRNGKRIKEVTPVRRFLQKYGYTHTCYFGNESEDSVVVESEKTAMLCWLKWGSESVATGGSNKLSRIEPGWKILPDFDDAGKLWMKTYPDNCVEWWNGYNEVSDGDDIGDMIMKNKIYEKRN